MSVIRFCNKKPRPSRWPTTPATACRPACGATTSTARTAWRALRAGTVHVNQYDEDDITVPFGGYKQSGNGRDKSLYAFDKVHRTEDDVAAHRRGLRR